MENDYYTVKKGDSLWGIAKYFGITVDELADYNHLTGKEKNLIHIGQKIYIPCKNRKPSSPDAKLHLCVVGLSNKPVKNAKLKVTHDYRTFETRTDSKGWLYDLNIDDHIKGLKIEFETYDRKWRQIVDETILPLGEKILAINLMTDKFKTQTLRKDGPTIIPDNELKKEIIKHTPQPASGKSPFKPLPEVPARPVTFETRTSNGLPTTVIAPLFAGENLKLNPGNEKFRDVIYKTAKRYQLTPHALAAIVHAEAAKVTKTAKEKGAYKDKPIGSWIEDSAAGTARGLGQFKPSTWFQYLAKDDTLGNKAAISFLGKPDKLLAASETLYRIDKGRKNEVDESARNKLLAWRNHGEYAIDGIGSNTEDNLRYLKERNIDVNKLPPDEKVKIAYIMHHEGGYGGWLYLTGQLKNVKGAELDDVKRTLIAQFRTKKNDGKAQAEELANRFGGDYVKAYYYFLANYTDKAISVTNCMIDQKNFKERSVYEVIKSVAGVVIEMPAGKITPTVSKPSQSSRPASTTTTSAGKEVGPAQGVGGVTGWSDPLDRCTIRVGGYKCSKDFPTKARAQSLFGGRGGKHHGIDLDALPGTPIKAVANGEIVKTMEGCPGYGTIILLKVNTNDLPSEQKAYAEKNIPQDSTIYFMYAHLSEVSIKPKNGKPATVTAGQVIGKTGNTGNAGKMIYVNSSNDSKAGAHLHFEVRRSASLTLGMGEWFDPKPFLTRCD